jgi:hypothetical protein
VGIGGLIAGQVAAKTGLLVLALAFLKKGFILVLVFGAALLRKFKSLFGVKTPAVAEQPPAPPESTAPDSDKDS